MTDYPDGFRAQTSPQNSDSFSQIGQPYTIYDADTIASGDHGHIPIIINDYSHIYVLEELSVLDDANQKFAAYIDCGVRYVYGGVGLGQLKFRCDYESRHVLSVGDSLSATIYNLHSASHYYEFLSVFTRYPKPSSWVPRPFAHITSEDVTCLRGYTSPFTACILSGSVTYTWIWGDGSANSSGSSVSHTWNVVGTFIVTLVVTNAYGSDVESRLFTVT